MPALGRAPGGRGRLDCRRRPSDARCNYSSTDTGIRRVSDNAYVPRHREEVINVRLADLLSGRGVNAHAETIVGTRRQYLPDVLLRWHGLPIAIECKLNGSGARSEVDEQVRGRLDANLASVGIGIVYPEGINEADDIAGKVSNRSA